MAELQPNTAVQDKEEPKGDVDYLKMMLFKQFMESNIDKQEVMCGKINQHGKPCQRIGKCPFHSEKEKKSLPKKGWTKDEHSRFLQGLKTYGRGNWKQIAVVVGNKTPTQIQSHAQKYFLRQKQQHKNKRSIHDFSLEDLEAASPTQHGNNQAGAQNLEASSKMRSTGNKRKQQYDDSSSDSDVIYSQDVISEGEDYEEGNIHTEEEDSKSGNPYSRVHSKRRIMNAIIPTHEPMADLLKEVEVSYQQQHPHPQTIVHSSPSTRPAFNNNSVHTSSSPYRILDATEDQHFPSSLTMTSSKPAPSMLPAPSNGSSLQQLLNECQQQFTAPASFSSVAGSAPLTDPSREMFANLSPSTQLPPPSTMAPNSPMLPHFIDTSGGSSGMSSNHLPPFMRNQLAPNSRDAQKSLAPLLPSFFGGSGAPMLPLPGQPKRRITVPL